MEETILEACIEHAMDELDHNGTGTEAEYRLIARNLLRNVIQTIIDRTPSPRTVDELTRILREGGVEVEALPVGWTIEAVEFPGGLVRCYVYRDGAHRIVVDGELADLSVIGRDRYLKQELAVFRGACHRGEV